MYDNGRGGTSACPQLDKWDYKIWAIKREIDKIKSVLSYPRRQSIEHCDMLFSTIENMERHFVNNASSYLYMPFHILLDVCIEEL